MLQIYCGDGKGKTTAALGLAVRAAGAGKRVHIIQMMKGRDTSELEALRKIPQITLRRCDRDYGFTFSMSDEDRAEITERHNELLREAERMMGEIDLLILDEFNCAYRSGLLDRDMARRFILSAKDEREIVLTGRGPDEKFIEEADYVSEISALKHPYTRGIAARRGIEY